MHFIKFRYLFPNIRCYLSAFFLETTLLPLQYHSVTILYFPRTSPVPSYLSSARRYPFSRVLTPPITFITFKTLKTFSTQNLHTCKFYCTFAPNCQLSNCQLSNVNCQLSTINCQLSTDCLRSRRNTLRQTAYGVANAMQCAT